MPTGTVISLFEAWLGTAAERIVMILGLGQGFAGLRITVERAVFLATGPAPGAAASAAHVELATCFQSTRKNVVTGVVFQRPATTPGALLGIRGSFLFAHALKGCENA